MDGQTGAEELITQEIRDDALLNSLTTTRLPCRFACYDRGTSLALSLRPVSKLPSGKQMVCLVTSLTASSASTWSADISGDSCHGN